ncbi:hypothetical protein ACS0TY_032143 [Phlomoides rotata]
MIHGKPISNEAFIVFLKNLPPPPLPYRTTVSAVLSRLFTLSKTGMLYFTDASYKHSLKEALQDVLEGRPYGRFLSYDLPTKQARVLLKDIYTANGVVVSPNQSFVVVCETAMRRCIRYCIQGPKKGSVDIFIENLPGFVDNIRYDGEC